MIRHQIMRQLMRHHYPPPTRGLDPALPRANLDLLDMQLLKEAKIAKHAPLRIKRDRAPDFIVEDVQRAAWQAVNVADFV